MIIIPKGTKDVLPKDSCKWQYIEQKAREIAKLYNLNEIRTPVFEHTELFLRGVGNTTDIVNKEMYTFLDKGERSITLKPEGTAGVVRSFIENGMDNFPMPVKTYYITPVFRYERPQSGRLREHHQFGVEVFGAARPSCDSEIITLAYDFISGLGIKAELNINSIGCPECRNNYNIALKAYLFDNLKNMCPDCNERYIKNPLRVLDCKVAGCIAANKKAPTITEHLCSGCMTHFEDVQKLLDATQIKFNINPYIVRGLDYYTRTVFEFITDNDGEKLTICGGGRYDKLVENLGGKPTPAMGFGMGIERLLAVIEKSGVMKFKSNTPQIYIAPINGNFDKDAYLLANKLRKEAGISAESDMINRSLNAQMKYANKINAGYVVVIGDEEAKTDLYTLKHMASGNEEKVNINQLISKLKESN